MADPSTGTVIGRGTTHGRGAHFQELAGRRVGDVATPDDPESEILVVGVKSVEVGLEYAPSAARAEKVAKRVVKSGAPE